MCREGWWSYGMWGGRQSEIQEWGETDNVLVRECSELWALVRIGLIREMLLKWTLKNSDFRVWCRICWVPAVKRSDRICKCVVSYGWQHSLLEIITICSESCRFVQDGNICFTTYAGHIGLCILNIFCRSCVRICSEKRYLFRGVMRLEREVNNSPPFSAFP